MSDLQAGDVVRMDNVHGEHRYIILEKNEHICSVVGSTSQIANKENYAHRRNPKLKNGYLYLEPSEYRSKQNSGKCSLTKQTIFDTNQVEKYIEDLITVKCDKISNDIKVKLINCITQSPELSQKEKEQYINNLG